MVILGTILNPSHCAVEIIGFLHRQNSTGAEIRELLILIEERSEHVDEPLENKGLAGKRKIGLRSGEVTLDVRSYIISILTHNDRNLEQIYPRIKAALAT